MCGCVCVCLCDGTLCDCHVWQQLSKCTYCQGSLMELIYWAGWMKSHPRMPFMFDSFFYFPFNWFFLYSSHNRANSLFKSKYKLPFKNPFTISDNDLIQKQFQLEKLNLSPPNPIETYQHCPFSYQLAQKKNLNMVLRCLSENLASFFPKPKSNLFIPVLLVHSNREQ